MTYSDGIARFPAQLVELLFQLAIGIAFVVVVKRRAIPGRVFALYLIVYGAFRFCTEPYRVTPKVWSGFSVYQALAVTMIALGALSFAIRARPLAAKPVVT